MFVTVDSIQPPRRLTSIVDRPSSTTTAGLTSGPRNTGQLPMSMETCVKWWMPASYFLQIREPSKTMWSNQGPWQWNAISFVFHMAWNVKHVDLVTWSLAAYHVKKFPDVMPRGSSWKDGSNDCTQHGHVDTQSSKHHWLFLRIRKNLGLTRILFLLVFNINTNGIIIIMYYY